MKPIKYLFAALSIIAFYAVFNFSLYWIAKYLLMNMI